MSQSSGKKKTRYRYREEAQSEKSTKHYELALRHYTRALQTNPEDRVALVARSSCYLALGQLELALKDAESSLNVDNKYVKGLYQKAEVLYHLGQFEQSLMYFHRGLHVRPGMKPFEDGVAKATQAIRNAFAKIKLDLGKKREIDSSSVTPDNEVVPRRTVKELDKNWKYLDALANDSTLKENIVEKKEGGDLISVIENGKEYVRKRITFWEQQQPMVCVQKNKNTSGIQNKN